MIKTCKSCNQKFEVDARNPKYRQQVFCDACKIKRREAKRKLCLYCRKPLQPSQHNHYPFCGQECFLRYYFELCKKRDGLKNEKSRKKKRIHAQVYG